MSFKFHKSVKFPIEVTKGKAEDLCKLRFLRKSELEPLVRHNMKHASEEMDKQLNVWYKEQKVTIGTLSRGQEKIYQSRKRLRREQKRIKKQEYARQQELVREKLRAIRTRMLMMRVVERFKQNAEKRKREREEEIRLIGPQRQGPPASSSALYSASRRRHMETIPEENGDDELIKSPQHESRDRYGKLLPLQLQNSPRRRDVDIRPDVTRIDIASLTARPGGNPDCPSPSADTARSEHSADIDPTSDTTENKKTIVVKLPRGNRPSSDRSLLGSNQGTRGSDSDSTSSENVFESEDSESDSDSATSDTSSAGSGVTISVPDETQSIPDELSLTLTRYKTSLSRRSDSQETIQASPRQFPDEESLNKLPNVQVCVQQRPPPPPLMLRYRERSFILSSKLKDQDSDSPRGSHLWRSWSLQDADLTEEERRQRYSERLESIRQKMTKEQSNINLEQEARNMTVYGTKAHSNAKTPILAPPNTPMLKKANPRRTNPRSQLSVVLLNQKRAQNTDKRKTVYRPMSEAVQTYERTRDGKFQPMGLARQHSFELPTMKERHQREKLLKAERDAMFGQDMKMKQFMQKFDTEVEQFRLPVLERGVPRGTGGPAVPTATIGSLFFQDVNPEMAAPIVIPSTSKNYNSAAMLRKCRYLREYTPLSAEQRLTLEKETSWQMRTPYKTTYVANVRI